MPEKTSISSSPNKDERTLAAQSNATVVLPFWGARGLSASSSPKTTDAPGWPRPYSMKPVGPSPPPA